MISQAVRNLQITSEWLDKLASDPAVDLDLDVVAETISRARGDRDEAILRTALDRPAPASGD